MFRSVGSNAVLALCTGKTPSGLTKFTAYTRDNLVDGHNTSTVVNYFGPSGQNYIPAQPNQMPCCWTAGTPLTSTTRSTPDHSALFTRPRIRTGWENRLTATAHQRADKCEQPASFRFSINCLTGKYNYGSESFAEKFHRYTYNGQNSEPWH